MSLAEIMAAVVLADALVWIVAFQRERRGWGNSLGVLAANVCVIWLNTIIVCLLVFLRVIGAR